MLAHNRIIASPISNILLPETTYKTSRLYKRAYICTGAG